MLKEEEAVVDIKLEEEKDQLNACTQTPKRRRSSGRASRMSSCHTWGTVIMSQ